MAQEPSCIYDNIVFICNFLDHYLESAVPQLEPRPSFRHQSFKRSFPKSQVGFNNSLISHLINKRKDSLFPGYKKHICFAHVINPSLQFSSINKDLKKSPNKTTLECIFASYQFEVLRQNLFICRC